VPFNLSADADIAELFSLFEKEMLATSGDGMLKMTRRIPALIGVPLVCNPTEMGQLVVWANQIDDITMGYVDAGGNLFSATGHINIQQRQTQTGVTTIDLLPRGEWTTVLA
jgi:hypothetical protein